MLTLISVWTLKTSHASEELLRALDDLSREVLEKEVGTLEYRVHTQRPSPIDNQVSAFIPMQDPTCSAAKPTSITSDRSTAGDAQLGSSPSLRNGQVVFIERYINSKAFEDHVAGPRFLGFLCAHIGSFIENPEKAGHPLAHTIFLTQEAGFER